MTRTASPIQIPANVTNTPGGLADREVRFDLIDAQILWAETEEAKGDLSAWNQGRWAANDAPCGTAYCIAGHVAASEVGGTFDFRSSASASRIKISQEAIVQLGLTEDVEDDGRVYIYDVGYAALGLHDLRTVLAEVEYARALFVENLRYGYDGLPKLESLTSYYQASTTDLFAGSNTIAELKRIRDLYALVTGEPLRYEGQYAVRDNWAVVLDAVAKYNAELDGKAKRRAELTAAREVLVNELAEVDAELAAL